MATRYSGPVVDAHIHLWRYDETTYPWIANSGAAVLQRDYLPADYLAVAQPCGVRSSVHIEAGWRVDDPVAETRWLTELEPPPGVADKRVVHVPLGSPDAADLLEQHMTSDHVVGVRDILSWHPDPKRSFMASRTRMADTVWRENFARLGKLGLSFDLMISPWQAEDALRLANDHADTVLVLNHCGSPFDRDAEGMQRWREGLKLLASSDNVMIKISDPVAYDPNWTADSLREVIQVCLETFGPGRSIFASDFPVLNMHIDYRTWIDVFAENIVAFSAGEQQAMFHDNAVRVYQL